MMRLFPGKHVGSALAGLAWALAVGAGFVGLQRYATKPGRAEPSPGRWPVECRTRADPGRANLVFLAHPRCPCTRAGIGELSRLMARCQGLVTAHVLFYRPQGSPKGWGHTDSWDAAAAIPGVRVGDDEGGAEAARFGGATSGHALLYGRDGRLLFSGGITTARGHAGDNPGRDAVVSFLTAGKADRASHPVFGCPILDDAAAEGAPDGF